MPGRTLDGSRRQPIEAPRPRAAADSEDRPALCALRPLRASPRVVSALLRPADDHRRGPRPRHRVRGCVLLDVIPEILGLPAEQQRLGVERLLQLYCSCASPCSRRPPLAGTRLPTRRPRAAQALTAPLLTVPAGEIALDGYDRRAGPSRSWCSTALVLAPRRRSPVARPPRPSGRATSSTSRRTTRTAPVLPVHTRYVAHRTAKLAVLDDMFRLAAHRWPRLHDVVHALMARQLRRTSRTLAILHLPREWRTGSSPSSASWRTAGAA